MEENSEFSSILKELEEVVLKNEETSKRLNELKVSLNESKERCHSALLDVYQSASKKLDEAFEETKSRLEQEHQNLWNRQEEREKIVQRSNSVLMKELIELLRSNCDESAVRKCENVVASVNQAAEVTGQENNIVFNFIPNQKLRKTKLGYFQLCDNLPSDFELSLLTPKSCIAIGKQVSCGIRGDLTKENLPHLEYGVRQETNRIPSKFTKVQDNLASFLFSPEVCGVYSIRVCLFGENIALSPLSLSVTKVAVASADTDQVSTNSLDPFGNSDISSCRHFEDLFSFQKLSKLEVESDVEAQKEDDAKAVVCVDKILDNVQSVESSQNTEEVVGENKLSDKVQSVDEGENKEVQSVDDGQNKEVQSVDDGQNKEVQSVGDSQNKEDCLNTICSPREKTLEDKQTKSSDDKQRKVAIDNGSISQIEELTEDDNIFSSEKQDKDENAMWKVGDLCLAKWEEDGGWYNAQISQVHTDARVLVTFVDYGNEDIVSNWVKTFNQIPPTDEFDVNVIPTETKNIDENNLKLEVPRNEDTEAVKAGGNDLNVGDVCLARWDEDSVWYNGQVRNIYGDGKFLVKFTDYGNQEVVCLPYIVKTENNIPEDVPKENIDQFVNRNKTKHGKVVDYPAPVDEPGHLFSIGDVCVAKWSQDGVWYNATVKSLLSSQQYQVVFSDYGNEATVQSTDMLTNVHEIPKHAVNDGFVDENVKLEEASLANEGITPSSLIQNVENVEEKPGCEFKVGEVCVARWEQDQVWYNGKIVANNKNGSYMVSFLDYGNTENVDKAYVVKDGSKIPDSINKDKIDDNVDTKQTNADTIESVPKGIVIEAEVKDESKTIIIEANEEEESSCVQLQAGADTWQPGDLCLALWSQDSVWYNAVVEGRNTDGFYTVMFYDYGNTELVQPQSIVKDSNALAGRGNQPVLDHNVKVDENYLLSSADTTLDANGNVISADDGTPLLQTSSSPEVKSQIMNFSAPDEVTSLNLLTFVTELPNGTSSLPVQETLRISREISAPIGICVLRNKNIVISSSGDDSVKMFSAGGEMISSVQSKRLFKRPSDLVTLSTGEFVMRDDSGLQLFTEEGVYVKDIAQFGVGQIDKCYGVAEDGEGRIVTINAVRAKRSAKSGSKGKGGLTNDGEMDIFFIDLESGEVVKKIGLNNIIQDKSKSKCRFLHCCKGMLYVVDLGLDCVYTLDTAGKHAKVVGSSGAAQGQFNDPAGVATDEAGNLIVADSRNHRIQIFNNHNQPVGDIQQKHPLNRPSGIYLDIPSRELYVLNYWGNSMLKYRIG